MTEGPLNESEMEWLEETLMSYGHDDASVIDVSELDGMLTAVLSGPVVVEPDAWLVAVWGGEKYIPRWKNDREMNRFIDLCFKHMNDIAERLSEYPDQFEPMFGYNDIDGESYTVVEEWCYGYMRGVALTDWSALPEELKADLKTNEKAQLVANGQHGETATVSISWAANLGNTNFYHGTAAVVDRKSVV